MFSFFAHIFFVPVAQLVDEASVTGNMISFPIIINFTFPFPLMNHCLMKKRAKAQLSTWHHLNKRQITQMADCSPSYSVSTPFTLLRAYLNCTG